MASARVRGAVASALDHARPHTAQGGSSRWEQLVLKHRSPMGRPNPAHAPNAMELLSPELLLGTRQEVLSASLVTTQTRLQQAAEMPRVTHKCRECFKHACTGNHTGSDRPVFHFSTKVISAEGNALLREHPLSMCEAPSPIPRTQEISVDKLARCDGTHL